MTNMLKLEKQSLDPLPFTNKDAINEILFLYSNGAPIYVISLCTGIDTNEINHLLDNILQYLD